MDNAKDKTVANIDPGEKKRKRVNLEGAKK